jgi:hypothetical protein
VVNTAAGQIAVKQYGAMLRQQLGGAREQAVALWMINRRRDSLELLKEFMDAVPKADVHAKGAATSVEIARKLAEKPLGLHLATTLIHAVVAFGGSVWSGGYDLGGARQALLGDERREPQGRSAPHFQVASEDLRTQLGFSDVAGRRRDRSRCRHHRGLLSFHLLELHRIVHRGAVERDLQSHAASVRRLAAATPTIRTRTSVLCDAERAGLRRAPGPPECATLGRVVRLAFSPATNDYAQRRRVVRRLR